VPWAVGQLTVVSELNYCRLCSLSDTVHNSLIHVCGLLCSSEHSVVFLSCLEMLACNRMDMGRLAAAYLLCRITVRRCDTALGFPRVLLRIGDRLEPGRDVDRPMSGRVGKSGILSGQHRVGIGFKVAHLGSAPPFLTDTNGRALQMPLRHKCGRLSF
jgi:hypothetical protein